ncbi:MAG: hypothetical protein JXA28_09145, partial [Bacteroidetes bacterium]|nr:hypothetical protein [Bacteroidota bacterium]
TEMIRNLEGIASAAEKFVDSKVRASDRRLRLLLGDRAFSRLEGRLQAVMQFVDERHQTAQRIVEHGWERRDHRVALLRQQLASHAPERFFRRGAVLLHRGGDPVTSVRQVQPGDFISITLYDGTAHATILQTEEHEQKKG